MKINPYLTFNGNCREAMSFYQECIGGELFFQTIGESPLSERLPEKMKKCILHSALSNGELIIMASDIIGEKGLLKGNSVSLLLNCNSEQELRNCYRKLSQGGEQSQPVDFNFYGALNGNLTDKFGNNWLLFFTNI